MDKMLATMETISTATPPSGFNIWFIIGPLIAILIIVFIVIFLKTEGDDRW